jgi:hypothetical protein
MLASGNTLQVGKSVVKRVIVPVMDVASLRDCPKRRRPNIPVKALAAARKIPFARPHAVKAPVKILRDGVKVDWISEPVWRRSADIHPLSVKNK